MIAEQWPLFGLAIRTPRLELRVPTTDQLGELAELAASGVHDPGTQPFAAAWTDGPRGQVARSVLQWQWGNWARWRVDDWELALVALAGGRVVGTQSLSARDFGVLREVGTGSWLGRAHHGRGFGTEMRTAVLELAFGGLDALCATSEAFDGNEASYGVSRKLGYADDGIARHVVRGAPVIGRRLRLDRATWAGSSRVPVSIEGLTAECREFFTL